jgi:hypothetical protein
MLGKPQWSQRQLKEIGPINRLYGRDIKRARIHTQQVRLTKQMNNKHRGLSPRANYTD